MAMETSITKEGVSYKEIQGTPEEQKKWKRATLTYANYVMK